jgi:hypothetical protein
MQDELQSKYYDALVERVRERLHLPSTAPLTRDHVLALWTLCISVVPHPEAEVVDACSLFSRQEHEVMEWIDDTKLLNKRGWAQRIALQMASPLMEDIHDALGSGRQKNPERRARMLFGHAESLCPLICQLGLFGSPVPESTDDDLQKGASESGVFTDKLLESLPEDVVQHLEDAVRGLPKLVIPPKPPLPRKWWGASVAPYAANVLFIVYEPEAGNSTSSDSVQGSGTSSETDDGNSSSCDAEYKVQIVMNEQIVRWDGLMAGSDEDGLLPLNTFMAILKARIEDFHSVCAVDGKPRLTRRLSSCSG